MNKIRKQAKRTIARRTQHGLDKRSAMALNLITSIGTERSCQQSLANYYIWCDFNDIHPDRYANGDMLRAYLSERSECVAQKTLNQDRKTLELVYIQELPRLRSQIASVLEKRSYSFDQVERISRHQRDDNSISTHIAYCGGLRAHELSTILPLEERTPSSHRPWDPRRFVGSPDCRRYTVIGKGGLIREVAIPLGLANELEKLRIHPKTVSDRGIYYLSHYDIGSGQAWSQSFSSASAKALGFSTGAHGLRHTFAKIRLVALIDELKVINPKLSPAQIRQDAFLILSQELGHFRPDIVSCYLR